MISAAFVAVALAATGVFCEEASLHVHALSRQLRVDLLWDAVPHSHFEVQRADSAEGPFENVPLPVDDRPFLSDFIGSGGQQRFYRLRAAGGSFQSVPWSGMVSATSVASNDDTLLTEVQESGFRYFYDYGHPVSGLARESFVRAPDLCATGATGMGFSNLVVGIERGFISRAEGRERTLKILRFLSTKAERYHGAFPHWIDGTTGQTIPFDRDDDGADVVETGFLIQGVLLAREYFTETSAAETEVRELADKLWRAVEWNWFAPAADPSQCMVWHWSPKQNWRKNLRIIGFNEAHSVYMLALASPTHAIERKYYLKGWESCQACAHPPVNTLAAVSTDEESCPLFFTHYSYLGFDPHRISFGKSTYFERFQALCRQQIAYAESKKTTFTGYGTLWGITASLGPDGYSAFSPQSNDNGTIAPTASISSMPYVPEQSRACLREMYLHHGKKLWGPFGFYDAFNLKRDWYSKDVLGIDVGPIAPMIENYRSGLCWRTFMKAPEIAALQKALTQSN